MPTLWPFQATPWRMLRCAISLGSWQAAVDVTNVFDKKYFSTCYPGEGCYYGEGRNISGSLSVKF